LVENLGIIAVVIMVTTYALEQRHHNFILAFAFGCALAAYYAWLIGSTPFLIAEGVWSLIAFKRWLQKDSR
jgi:hypothetical protein